MAGVDTMTGGADITPADSDLTNNVRQIHVGGAGTLRVTTLSGETLNFTCVAGQRIDLEVTRIHSSGTSATNIVGLY